MPHKEMALLPMPLRPANRMAAEVTRHWRKDGKVSSVTSVSCAEAFCLLAQAGLQTVWA